MRRYLGALLIVGVLAPFGVRHLRHGFVDLAACAALTPDNWFWWWWYGCDKPASGGGGSGAGQP